MNKYELAIAKARATNEPAEADNLIVFPSVDTTMRIVDEAIRAGKQDGYTVITLTQTNGVGSKDPATGAARTWTSIEGNLMFSRGLRIDRAMEHSKEIDMIAAKAVGECVMDFLADTEKKVEWKYPNDVLVDGAKIAGILTRPHPDFRDWVNIGIGVNIVAAPGADAMREKAAIKRATYLHECGAERADVASFMEQFDRKFESALTEFRANRRFENVLESMGFAQPGTGLLSVVAASGEVITGFYGGIRTTRDETGAEIDYLRIDRQGMPYEFPYRDLHILPASAPQPQQKNSSPVARHG
jgi:biotin-[acetyl-CoA-carboxylase] ligase BirA-like protein